MKVAVEGKTADLKEGKATWGFNVTKPATATVNIVNSAGSTVYTGNFSVNAGNAEFRMGRPQQCRRSAGRTAPTH